MVLATRGVQVVQLYAAVVAQSVSGVLRVVHPGLHYLLLVNTACALVLTHEM